jgi:hypothetical protein
MNYSKKRTTYNNKWPNHNIEFECQKVFTKLLRDKGLQQQNNIQEFFISF